jgi:hypothetical protein
MSKGATISRGPPIPRIALAMAARAFGARAFFCPRSTIDSLETEIDVIFSNARAGEVQRLKPTAHYLQPDVATARFCLRSRVRKRSKPRYKAAFLNGYPNLPHVQ